MLFLGLWHAKKENSPLSITGSLVASADEVSVVILSEPLLTGRYLGKRLPENCIFPEMLHVFESASYRMIAGKTTMLTTEAAEEIVDLYNVDDKKKSCMVSVVICRKTFPKTCCLHWCCLHVCM